MAIDRGNVNSAKCLGLAFGRAIYKVAKEAKADDANDHLNGLTV